MVSMHVVANNISKLSSANVFKMSMAYVPEVAHLYAA